MAFSWCCRRSKRSPSATRCQERTCSAEFDLLLLGTDGSGKSTFLRQMKIIHDGGFTDEELADIKPDVYRNLTDAMTILIHQAERLGLSLKMGESLENAKICGNPEAPISTRLAAIRRLWEYEESIKETYRRRAEFSTTHPINVSAKYFLDAAERIEAANYLPITEDIIRMRRGTEGVITHDFHVPGNSKNDEYLFRITDVGGEAMERQKWFEIIEHYSRLPQRSPICMIFLVAVDEFDTRVIYQDRERNRLKESADIFRQLRNLQWIPRDTNFILFLNKVDVFREKIQTVHISDHFPKFNGFPRDYDSGIQFIESMYVPDKRKERLRNRIFCHQTCATDTEQMRKIFSNVKETILSIYLASLGVGDW